MPTKEIKNKKLWSILGVITLIIIGLFVIYLTKAYPIAMVGSSFISANDLNKDYEIAKNLDSSVSKEQVFNQLVESKKKEQLAKKLRIDTENAFAKEWNYYQTNNQDQYTKLIKEKFFGDEALFEKYVARPQTYDALLRIKYNSNFGLNNNAYNRAENIIVKLNQGQSFEDLAKTFSDDKVSGQLGGDIGFVGQGEILPELQDTIQSATLGEVKKEVVVSRLGYHILFPIEQAQKDLPAGRQVVKIWHIKHILIQTTGYETWLNQQLNQIGTHKLLNI